MNYIIEIQTLCHWFYFSQDKKIKIYMSSTCHQKGGLPLNTLGVLQGLLLG